MKIGEILLNSKNGDFVQELNCVCCEKSDLLTASNSSRYFNLTFRDVTGEISFPIFDELQYEDYKVGVVYKLSGTVNVWNDKKQLKIISVAILEKGQYNVLDFVESYSEEEIEKARCCIENIISQLEQPYKNICRFIMYDDDRIAEAYLRSPSAAKHHGNKIGGLIVHTYGVLKAARNIYLQYNTSGVLHNNNIVNIDRLCCKAILHDAAKIYEYAYDTCIYRKENVVGHVYDGISMVDNACNILGIDISIKENLKMSILCHHGKYGPKEPNNIEDIIIHLADMIDSRVVGAIEENERAGKVE